MLLKFNEQTFGLDISDRCLRLVQLEKTSGRIKIVSYSEVPIPLGIIQDGIILEKAKLVVLLKKLIKEVQGKKLYSNYAVVSLPDQKTFIKLINIPFVKNDKDVLKLIIDEAKNHIPYALNKIFIDWQFVNPNDKTKVIIGVCPKDIVLEYQNILKEVSIVPIALEIEAISISRCLFPLSKQIDSPTMIIDFGATRTGVVIYEKDYIPFSLTLSISSDNLTEFIKNKLKITYEEAEEAKINIGLDITKAEGKFYELLIKPLDELARQIRESKYFYYEHFSSAKKINKVILTGNGANLPGLIEYISKNTKLSSELANPKLNLTRKGVNIPASKFHSYTTSIGLALRNFE